MKIKKFLFILLAMLAIFCIPQKANADFQICFLDVGQGDASIISCDGHYVLIDGGEPEYSSKIYSYLEKKGINHLDYVIATHVHSDHIGGLPGALNYATVDNVFCNKAESDETSFLNLRKYTEAQGKEITVPEIGSSFIVGSAEMEIIGPVASFESENDNSLVVRFVYGNTSFLFMGDAEKAAESELINSGVLCDTTVLKVGHHASKTSSSISFLSEIHPKYSVISVGKSNQYGHPYKDTVNNLELFSKEVYRTDEHGDIICTSNGNTVTFDSRITIKSSSGTHYVCNTSTKKAHSPYCSSVSDMKEKNKMDFTGTAEELKSMGYAPCGRCKPF